MRAAPMLAALALVAGCASEPFDVARPGEMARNEPGIFSGPDGMFTIFGPSHEASAPAR